jgi:hypothetical protein
MLKLLIFIVLIKLITSKLQNEYQIISRIIGNQRVNQHFSDNLQFLEAIKYENHKINTSINNINTLNNSPYIICSDHKSGQNALKSFQFDLGKLNAHTLYSSKTHDSSCFIIKIDNIIKDDVNLKDLINKISKKNNIQFNIIMPLPMSLKLHQSSMMLVHSIHSSSFFDLINNKDHVLKRRMLSLLNDPIKIKDLEIIIDFDLGVYNKNSNNIKQNLKDIEIILSNHNINGLENIVESTKSVLSSNSILSDKITSNIWKQSHHILNNQDDICDFSKFSIVNKNEIKSDVNSISISGLSSLLQSRENKYYISNNNDIYNNDKNNACIANLLANFANHPNIINIAIKPKMRVFNNNGKSIVQANSTNNTHTPYTNIGLNGSNQIIGVGDSGLDDYQCFFSNDDGSVVQRSSYLSPTYDKSKRKVIQYIDYMNGIEETQQGHGI